MAGLQWGQMTANREFAIYQARAIILEVALTGYLHNMPKWALHKLDNVLIYLAEQQQIGKPLKPN
jgi:hypothetical protein